MAEAAIPVDLFNPGQVFACLGFLEAADILLGGAEGAFDWGDEGNVRFRLSSNEERNPVEVVLAFLANADIRQLCPPTYDANLSQGSEEVTGGQSDDEEDGTYGGSEVVRSAVEISEMFPAKQGDKMALPIQIKSDGYSTIELSHWADGSSRDTFKLYSGNRSAYSIARAMLLGVRQKPSKAQASKRQPTDIVTKGLSQLWQENRGKLAEDPFNVVTPMGGSFNFDPRGAWTAIDTGYSPNDQKYTVEASPIVEVLAALGMEHARPHIPSTRQVHYAVWGLLLPPLLARAALTAVIPSLPMRRFHFKLDLSGKNKVVMFSQEEFSP
jgi:CRISPR-associated protein Csx14